MKVKLHKSPWSVVLALFLITGASLGLRGFWGSGNSTVGKSTLGASTEPNSQQVNTDEVNSNTSSEETDSELLTDEKIKKLFSGFWKSDYYGVRHLTIREDGTATIFYQPNMVARFVMGAQLTIHYDWEYDIENEEVVFTSTEGSPQKSYDYVLEKWGQTQTQGVIDADENHLLLLDMDGKTKHDWRRIEAIPDAVLKQFQ